MKSLAKKNSPRKRLVNKLDRICSLYWRKKVKYCVCCGSPENLQLGHIFSRISYSTRWDHEEEGNCTVQCAGCNYKHEYHAYTLYSWYIGRYGIDKFEALESRYKRHRKYSNQDLEDLYDLIKEKHDKEEEGEY